MARLELLYLKNNESTYSSDLTESHFDEFLKRKRFKTFWAIALNFIKIK